MRWILALMLAAACGCSSADGAVATTNSAEAPGDSVPGAAPAAGAGACLASPPRQAIPSCARTTSDAIDEALAQIALDRCSVGHTIDELADSLVDPRDPRVHPDVLAFLQKPLGMPAYGASFASDLDVALASDTPVAQAIAAAAVRRGAPIEGCEDGAWYAISATDPAPLGTALLEVGASRTDVTGVPRDLQAALVPIVRAIAALGKDVTAARKVDAKAQEALATVPTWMIGIRHFELSNDLLAQMDAVDVDGISRAALRVALVIERAKLARFAGHDVPDSTWATPFGAIVLRGPAAHTYEAGTAADGAAFVLDTGGDDVYRAPVAASTLAHPIATLVDLGGKDTYTYAETRVPEDAIGRRLPSDGAGRAPDGRTLSRTFRQGAGVLGVGLLFDLGSGADTYRSLVGSQGIGTHGVGVVYDEAGDDTYVAEGFAQGGAAWGIGMLLDGAGNDTRTIYAYGQGFGFTRGLGAVVDVAGDDAYVAIAGQWPGAPAALAGDLLYASEQLPGPPASKVGANMSFAQGCGMGHRPNWPDPGFPMPGGIGLLRDRAGKDTYGAGVFAQGFGFVQGLGMLVDDAGDDRYDALYYAQGAAAHMGLGSFDDKSGADAYDTRVPAEAAALGFGHDMSSAIHYDEAGDDTYAAPGLVFGTAEDNGIALFVNTGGSDAFRAAGGACLGDAITSDISGARKALATVGVFVKAGGASRYEVGDDDEDRSGQSWSSNKHNQRASGVDRPNGTAALR